MTGPARPRTTAAERAAYQWAALWRREQGEISVGIGVTDLTSLLADLEAALALLGAVRPYLTHTAACPADLAAATGHCACGWDGVRREVDYFLNAVGPSGG
jgi:hypothetical protein